MADRGPRRFGEALVGMRAVLSPVLELSGELVELVFYSPHHAG